MFRRQISDNIDMAKNYKKGANRERQVLELLRSEGWYAERTAGSHGEADVIALKAGHMPRLIQVKCTKSTYAGFNHEAREELRKMAEVAGGVAELCWWPTDRKGPRFIQSDQWPGKRSKFSDHVKEIESKASKEKIELLNYKRSKYSDQWPGERKKKESKSGTTKEVQKIRAKSIKVYSNGIIDKITRQDLNDQVPF